MVSSNDQKEMENYFTGVINSSDSINLELIESNRNKGDYLGKRQKSSSNWVDKNVEKKGPIEDIDEDERKTLEQIRKWERTLESKNQKLRKNKSFKACIEMLEARKTNKTIQGSDVKIHRNLLEQILS